MLGEEFDILEAENGKEGLEILQQYGTSISIVLLDIVMPVVDGFEVLDFMIKEHWNEEIPVIMISSENSPDTMRRAYEMGVVDYISRPFDARVVYRRVLNTIKFYAKQRHLVTLITNQVYEKERKELEEAGNSYEEMLKNYIEENKEEEHTGTKKADTDAGKESIKDGFEKGSRVY
jgi:putative two-component system response regulator